MDETDRRHHVTPDPNLDDPLTTVQGDEPGERVVVDQTTGIPLAEGQVDEFSHDRRSGAEADEADLHEADDEEEGL